MFAEKEPSQKEISSSNDDFSGSMLIFWGCTSIWGWFFEGHWVFSIFTMISYHTETLFE